MKMNYTVRVFFRYPDVVLATLLCIRANLCRRRFEIKVNDMVFVGFPMQMPATAAGSASSHSSPNTCSSQPSLVHPSPKREQSSTVSYNIVFAVKVTFECSSVLTSQLWQPDITFGPSPYDLYCVGGTLSLTHLINRTIQMIVENVYVWLVVPQCPVSER